jgi:hypothetical protein
MISWSIENPLSALNCTLLNTPLDWSTPTTNSRRSAEPDGIRRRELLAAAASTSALIVGGSLLANSSAKRFTTAAAKFSHTFRTLGRPKEAELLARRSLHMGDGYDRGRLLTPHFLLLRWPIRADHLVPSQWLIRCNPPALLGTLLMSASDLSLSQPTKM